MNFADLLNASDMRFRKWEIVPCTLDLIIHVNINIIEYTQEFLPPRHFLLRRILTRPELEFIRLTYSEREMYRGPGWLHTDYKTALVVPELLMMDNAKWTIQVGFRLWKPDIHGNSIRIAMQGERAIELQK